MAIETIRDRDARPRVQARISGIGTSGFYKRGTSPFSAHHLAAQAVKAAAEDAGIDIKSIDGLVSYAGEPVMASALVDGLGLDRFRFGAQPNDMSGGGVTHALQLAVAAIESNVAETVVVYKVMKQDNGHRYGVPGGYMNVSAAGGRRVEHDPVYAKALAGSFSAPFGASVPVQHWALHARRHMHEFGTTSEQFGAVATTFRRHAQRNPAAMNQAPMTIEDHQRSRLIASPLRLYDCCMENDGAGAIIVTTAERAADSRAAPVQILAAAYGTGLEMTTMHAWNPYPSANLRDIARRLYRDAGVTAADIDNAQIYDHFSSHIIMTLEDLGFCEVGAGGPFVESGAIEWPLGSIPTNTSGGMLSEVYLIAMNLLIEGVRQIRGESTCQVEDSKLSIVTSGGTSSPTGALLLAGC